MILHIKRLVCLAASGLFLLALGGCLSLTLKPQKQVLNYNLEKALGYENVVPVAVIGSGPAGLSAALYIARAGMKAFVFAGPEPQGQLTRTTYIENFPGRVKILGPVLMNDLQVQAESFGACVINDTVINIDTKEWPFSVTTQEGRKFKALAIVLATGASPCTLNIPGEKEFWGKGVTTCAVCDAHFYQDKEVVVVGGGNSAAEQVFELAGHVSKVTVLVRKDQMRANTAERKLVEATSNATIEYNRELLKIYGDPIKGGVTHIDVLNNQTGIVEKRPIDGVFLAIGHIPRTDLVKQALKIDEDGCIVVNGKTQQTSIQGIFAAGEVQDSKYRQAAIAAGEGVKASLDAIGFLYSLGFNSSIGRKLDEKFFEVFSDKKLQLHTLTVPDDVDKYINVPGVVIVDFYTKVCPECIKLLPMLEAVAFKMQDQIKVYKCDIQASKGLRYVLLNEKDLKLRTVPSLAVFKDGKFIDMITHVDSPSELYAYLTKFVEAS
jgi:thioredoxin reductase (NADPH)